jgi:hypothetical protein
MLGFAEGYNSVTQASINARWGKDVFAECAREAEEAWQRKRSKE